MITIDTGSGRSHKLKHFREQLPRVHKSDKSNKAYLRAQYLAFSNGIKMCFIKFLSEGCFLLGSRCVVFVPYIYTPPPSNSVRFRYCYHLHFINRKMETVKRSGTCVWSDSPALISIAYGKCQAV